MDWNESISLYRSLPWILDGISPILFIRYMTRQIKEKRCQKKNGSVTDTIERSSDVECSRNQHARIQRGGPGVRTPPPPPGILAKMWLSGS